MSPRSFVIGTLVGLSLSLTAVAARPVVPPAVQAAIARLLGDRTTAVEFEDGKYEVSTATRLEVVLDVKGVVEEVEL